MAAMGLLFQGASSGWVHDYGPTLVALTIGFVQAVAFLWAIGRTTGQRHSDLDALAEWSKSHQQHDDKQDQGIVELKGIAASMQATATAQAESLRLVQQELRDNRNQIREQNLWRDAETGGRNRKET